jgi:AcrR family transcriptional regulator
MRAHMTRQPPDPDVGPRLPFFAAAEALFVRHGFEKTTVEEICRTVGSSKRTFYRLFRNKLDLLLQLSLHVAEEILERWHEKAGDEKSATEQLELFILEYENVAREREIFKILMSVPGVFSPDADLSAFENSPLIGAMAHILECGASTGEFQVSDPEYMAWVIFAYLDSTYYLLPMMGGRPGPLEDEKIATEVRSLLIRGLLTRTENGG